SQLISEATEEQTSSARQVSTAVENANELTQSAASAAEEMSAATEQLSSMAQQLHLLMAQFKIQDRTSPDQAGQVQLARTASADAHGQS
ncbi:MAG TPA: methyl-accepting chemotaxis protein, partial [Spirochaetia bacterium]|nr:methyl-accepting chemotaxis protein [Spirochaetia bacterium]